jgi:hypothetical protein
MRRQFKSLVTICISGFLPSIALGQLPHSRPPKLATLPLSQEFPELFREIFQAANDDGFETLKGPPMIGQDSSGGDHVFVWRGKVLLPSAYECDVTEFVSRTRQSAPSYLCMIQPMRDERSRNAMFDAVGAALRAGLGPSFVMREYNPLGEKALSSHSSVQFCTPPQTAAVANDCPVRLTVAKEKDGAVLLISVNVPLSGNVLQPNSKGQSQTDTPRPLPPARLTRQRTDLGGLAANIVVNQTTSELTLEFNGGEQHRITIAAGGSRTITLSPGIYRVTARVAAPRIIPFEGQQTYAADSEYQTEFYIQQRE